MTKDLALLVGPDQKWLTTEGFLDKVDENLRKGDGLAAVRVSERNGPWTSASHERRELGRVAGIRRFRSLSGAARALLRIHRFVGPGHRQFGIVARLSVQTRHRRS